MKILITGAKGILGSALSSFAENEGHVVLRTDKDTLNIVNELEIIDFFETTKVDIILNCAVIGPIESEKKPTLAKQVNLEGLGNLLKWKGKAKLIHFSSPAVFDAYPPLHDVTKGRNFDCGYCEEDITSAQSVYGKTKIEGENLLEKTETLIIRTSWLYSNTTLLESISNQATNDIARPTHCEDIWKFVKIALKEDLKGIYHVCGPEIMSRYEQVTILKNKGTKQTKLEKPCIRPLAITKIVPLLKKHKLSLSPWKVLKKGAATAMR